jgi:hypothetical protein
MFWILFLAHLLGDYPFQPNWLVANKRHTWALLLHGAIHFMFVFVLVGQSRLQLLPQLLVLAVAHIIIDATKTSLSTKQSLSMQSSYLLDQAIHLVLLALTALWIEGSITPASDTNTWGWAVILSGYVFVTYAWGTTERLLTENLPQYNEEVIAQMSTRMIARAAFLTLALFLLQRPSSLALLAAINIPYLSGNYRRRALVTDLMVTLATVAIVLIGIGS